MDRMLFNIQDPDTAQQCLRFIVDGAIGNQSRSARCEEKRKGVASFSEHYELGGHRIVNLGHQMTLGPINASLSRCESVIDIV